MLGMSKANFTIFIETFCSFKPNSAKEEIPLDIQKLKALSILMLFSLKLIVTTTSALEIFSSFRNSTKRFIYSESSASVVIRALPLKLRAATYSFFK